MTKFQTILTNATQADGIVREKYDKNRDAMVLLGKSEGEIQASLPKAGAQAAVLSGSQVL